MAPYKVAQKMTAFLWVHMHAQDILPCFTELYLHCVFFWGQLITKCNKCVWKGFYCEVSLLFIQKRQQQMSI